MNRDCSPALHRRGFLMRAAAALTVGIGTGACRTQAAYEPERIARPGLLAAMREDTVRDIGQRYLASTPAERDQAALVTAIEHSARELASFPWSPLPSLDALIAEDFMRGRTVLPGGWVLSATEARQCALFALHRS